jgi:hypothetical protein
VVLEATPAAAQRHRLRAMKLTSCGGHNHPLVQGNLEAQLDDLADLMENKLPGMDASLSGPWLRRQNNHECLDQHSGPLSHKPS